MSMHTCTVRIPRRYAKQRMLLNERSRQLLASAQRLGLDAHRKRDARSVRKYNEFRQAVYFLERDWNRVKTAYKERGGSDVATPPTCYVVFLCFVIHPLL